MIRKLKIDFEEKFLRNLLFNNNVDRQEIKNLNLDILIRKASSHLVLPTLFIQLKKKKLLEEFPLELKAYFKFIYKKNKRRNEDLIREISSLNQLLKKEKIDFVFIKGAANITSGLYNDLGERMVSDIDILVKEEHIEDALNAIQKVGFTSLNYSFFEDRHITRQVNKNNLFGVEIHRYLFKNNYEPKTSNEALKNKIYIKNIPVPDFNYQLINNIVSFQINDCGNRLFSYSYRNIYDTMLIKKKITNFNYLKFIDGEIKSNYFMILNELGVDKINENKFSKWSLFKFRFKYSSKFNYFIFKLISNLLNVRYNTKRVFEVIKNQEYRRYLKNKLFGKI